MSKECKNILIFGATGLIGSYIAQEIIRNKSKFEKIVVFTSAGTFESKTAEMDGFKKAGVEVIVGDVTNANDVTKAYKDIDTVVSAVGRNVIEHQVELVRLANESPSVHRFFPSEYGTDIAHGPASEHEKPHQKKLKVRAALQAADDLDHTYVVVGPYADGMPGLYLGPSRTIKEAGNFDVLEKEAVLIGDGNSPISFTTMKDTGKLVALALSHPEASRNKALRVNSFTASDSQILKEFEKQTGGQPWKVSYTSLDTLKKLEEERWNEGNPLAVAYTLRRIWNEGGTLYEKRDNHLIEGEDVVETLSEAVAEAIHVQRTYQSKGH